MSSQISLATKQYPRHPLARFTKRSPTRTAIHEASTFPGSDGTMTSEKSSGLMNTTPFPNASEAQARISQSTPKHGDKENVTTDNRPYCPSPFPSTVMFSRKQFEKQCLERQKRYEGIHKAPSRAEDGRPICSDKQMAPRRDHTPAKINGAIRNNDALEESTFPETILPDEPLEASEQALRLSHSSSRFGAKRKAPTSLDLPARNPRPRILESEFGASIRPSDQSSPKNALRINNCIRSNPHYTREASYLDMDESSVTRFVPARQPKFYERGTLLVPRDGKGGRLPPLYKEGPKLTEAKRLTNRYHRSRGSVFIRLEGKDACDHCQEDAISGWEARDQDYIGCWVKVATSWRKGDPVPTHVVGGCGECRSVGRGSRKGMSGCSLNGKRQEGVEKGTSAQVPKQHNAVGTITGPPSTQSPSPPPSPLNHYERMQDRACASVPRHSPQTQQSAATSAVVPSRHQHLLVSPREALATAKCLTKYCATHSNDEDAHASLRRAIKEIVFNGWQSQAEKETDWWPFACRYLKDWSAGLRGGDTSVV